MRLQFVGQGLELLLCASFEVAAGDFTELAAETPLISFGHEMIAHREQAIVFLENVHIHQVDVGRRGFAEVDRSQLIASAVFVEHLPHLADQTTRLAVLIEHHADRPTLTRDTTLFENRKQQVFFLRMMTGVGKEPEERNALVQGLDLQAIVGLGSFDQLLQDVKNALDDAVLFG